MKIAWLLPLLLLMSGCWTTGEGTKVGTVIKVAQEGAFVKTWEFEMVRGGMAGGSGSFSVAPAFITVEDERMLPMVQEALDKQVEIEITYREELVAPFRSSGGEDKFLTSIRFR